jgi:predicted GH43/DUF377 family glycosyl hydrolase
LEKAQGVFGGIRLKVVVASCTGENASSGQIASKTKMKWRKQRLIYAPSGKLWWAKSYASLPTVEVLSDVIRIYFAALDENRFGRIGYVDVDPENPHRIITESKEPLLDIGPLGAFDDCGVVPSCVLKLGGRKHIYYIGFQRAERVPYMLFTGLARKGDDGLFVRHARTPILDRTAEEPFSRSAPFVVFHDGLFKMWYWSCTEWIQGAEWVHYHNVLRYATSNDGIVWRTDAHICLQPDAPDEFSIGRPVVIVRGSFYQMWYSIRSFSPLYSIGYAESNDGVHWDRKDDEVGIHRSEHGWDSEMICYPFVVEIRGVLHMFYNGNRHGSTGFGYATLES